MLPLIFPPVSPYKTPIKPGNRFEPLSQADSNKLHNLLGALQDNEKNFVHPDIANIIVSYLGVLDVGGTWVETTTMCGSCYSHKITQKLTLFPDQTVSVIRTRTATRGGVVDKKETISTGCWMFLDGSDCSTIKINTEARTKGNQRVNQEFERSLAGLMRLKEFGRDHFNGYPRLTFY